LDARALEGNLSELKTRASFGGAGFFMEIFELRVLMAVYNAIVKYCLNPHNLKNLSFKKCLFCRHYSLLANCSLLLAG